VQGEKFFDNLNGLDLSSSKYSIFRATLKTTGKLHFDGKAYSFPVPATREVRRRVENRSDSIPEKTGGWFYWHFRDQAGRWCQIEELRIQAEGLGHAG
jgi:hypothetical protein